MASRTQVFWKRTRCLMFWIHGIHAACLLWHGWIQNAVSQKTYYVECVRGIPRQLGTVCLPKDIMYFSGQVCAAMDMISEMPIAGETSRIFISWNIIQHPTYCSLWSKATDVLQIPKLDPSSSRLPLIPSHANGFTSRCWRSCRKQSARNLPLLKPWRRLMGCTMIPLNTEIGCFKGNSRRARHKAPNALQSAFMMVTGKWTFHSRSNNSLTKDMHDFSRGPMLQCLLWFGPNRFEFTSRVRCQLVAVCQLVNSMKTDTVCVVLFPSNNVVTGFPAE